MSEWIPVKKRLPKTHKRVDIWMHITPSFLSMGMGDSFRVTEVWREDGKWFHYHKGTVAELNAWYITHWMNMPRPPADE